MIVFLAKAFEEKEHAEAFLKGSMYANRLSHFKKLEGAYGRGDEYEGAIMPPLDDFAFTLEATNPTTGEVVGGTTITGEDLAAPAILSLKRFNHINVFCMYAGRFEDTTPAAPRRTVMRWDPTSQPVCLASDNGPRR